MLKLYQKLATYHFLLQFLKYLATLNASQFLRQLLINFDESLVVLLPQKQVIKQSVHHQLLFLRRVEITGQVNGPARKYFPRRNYRENSKNTPLPSASHKNLQNNFICRRQDLAFFNKFTNFDGSNKITIATNCPKSLGFFDTNILM